MDTDVFHTALIVSEMRENNNYLKRSIRRLARQISKNLSKTNDYKLRVKMYYSYRAHLVFLHAVNIDA